MRLASLLVLPWLLAACSQSIAVGDPKVDDIPNDGDSGLDEDPDTTEPDPFPDNEPPLADAGEDFTALVAEEVTLNGTGSYDPDGDEIDFDWSFIDLPLGSSAVLINESRPDPSFFADRPGVYIIELAVSDGLTVSTDQVTVEVEAPNEGPVANAGADQNVNTGDVVVLNGSLSYDPDGDPLEFQWTLIAVPGGSAAVLNDPTSPLPQFTADVSGVYVAELVVTDGTSSSGLDQVRITALDGSDSDCLSCAAAEAELRRRAQLGDLAGVGLLALLPLVVLVVQRRR